MISHHDSGSWKPLWFSFLWNSVTLVQEYSVWYGITKGAVNTYDSRFRERIYCCQLKYMRQFYLTFPNSYALRSDLSWTQYRLLTRVENDNTRELYMQEAVKFQWSTRQLERQINSTLIFDFD